MPIELLIPYYYRADEGLPKLDKLIFTYAFHGEMVGHVMSDLCDIGTHSTTNHEDIPHVLNMAQEGRLVSHIQSGVIFEHLTFGVDSFGSYGDGNGRPDWFQDVRVRQALAMCTNRAGPHGANNVWPVESVDSYASPYHRLRPANAAEWPYDVAAANALLDEVGYLDSDGDGLREDPVTGTPFAIELMTNSRVELRPQIVSHIAENWLACGVQVNEVILLTSELFAPLTMDRCLAASLMWRCLPGSAIWSCPANIGSPTAFLWAKILEKLLKTRRAGPMRRLMPPASRRSRRFGDRRNTWRPIKPPGQSLRGTARAAAVSPCQAGRGPARSAEPCPDSTQNSEMWNLFELDLQL